MNGSYTNKMRVVLLSSCTPYVPIMRDFEREMPRIPILHLYVYNAALSPPSLHGQRCSSRHLPPISYWENMMPRRGAESILDIFQPPLLHSLPLISQMLWTVRRHETATAGDTQTQHALAMRLTNQATRHMYTS